MPNRILRDWTDSETIDNLSVCAERFFARLIMKVDDYGRYSANNKILKSTLFPLKTDVRETDISLWLSECEQCGLIALYNVALKEYVQIWNFKQTLRQKNEKYPPPDNLHITRVADDTQVLRTREHEKKRNETNQKTKGREVYAREEFENEVLFSIEECIPIALKDERFLKANKATEKELIEFNRLLEKRGVYEKNPLDYKNHFANWKLGGKMEEIINNGIPQYLTNLNNAAQ